MLVQQRQLTTRAVVALSQVVAFLLPFVATLVGGTNFMSILLWLCRSFNLNLKCYPAKCNRHSRAQYSSPISPIGLSLFCSALIFHLFTITTFYYIPLPTSQPASHPASQHLTILFIPLFIFVTLLSFVPATHFQPPWTVFNCIFVCLSNPATISFPQKTQKPLPPSQP